MFQTTICNKTYQAEFLKTKPFNDTKIIRVDTVLTE